MAANNTVRHLLTSTMDRTNIRAQLDRLVGLAMLIIASTVFLYYTVWTLLIVRIFISGYTTPIADMNHSHS